MIRETNRLLEQYTYVMENKSALVGKMLKNGPKQDWADEVEIRLTEEQRLKTAAELGTEQCVATS